MHLAHRYIRHGWSAATISKLETFIHLSRPRPVKCAASRLKATQLNRQPTGLQETTVGRKRICDAAASTEVTNLKLKKPAASVLEVAVTDNGVDKSSQTKAFDIRELSTKKLMTATSGHSRKLTDFLAGGGPKSTGDIKAGTKEESYRKNSLTASAPQFTATKARTDDELVWTPVIKNFEITRTEDGNYEENEVESTCENLIGGLDHEKLKRNFQKSILQVPYQSRETDIATPTFNTDGLKLFVLGTGLLLDADDKGVQNDGATQKLGLAPGSTKEAEIVYREFHRELRLDDDRSCTSTSSAIIMSERQIHVGPKQFQILNEFQRSFPQTPAFWQYIRQNVFLRQPNRRGRPSLWSVSASR